MNDLNEEDEVFSTENKDAIEAINAVRRINEEIYDQIEEDEGFQLEFLTNGFCSGIKFLGDIIWNEDDNERKYDEEEDEYEPMEGFLRRQINEILKKTANIEVLRGTDDDSGN